MLRKLTEALAVAHSQITHRDLKPANIFIKNNDISLPIIMDFGLSSPAEQGGPDGLLGGTPKYMAPEQFMSPQSIDRRADLFALGMIAYELLTDGEIPVCSLKDCATTGRLPQFRPEEVLPPSTFCAALPKELDRLILQMLDYDRDKRPQTALEIKAVLDSAKLLNPFALSRSNETRSVATCLVPAATYVVATRAASAVIRSAATTRQTCDLRLRSRRSRMANIGYS